MPLLDVQNLKREIAKALLRPLLRWRPLKNPAPGFSLVLPAPWALRHILDVNLRFVQKANLDGLHRFHVVFDRVMQPGADEFIKEVRARFPDLPLEFQFQPRLAGSIVRLVNRSHFYANLSWTEGLGACTSRYAILHHFDLYPTDPDLFVKIIRAMQERGLHFSGMEYRMDKEWWDVIKPPTVGGNEMGIDLVWLRQNARPLDCWHRVVTINGTRCNLDGFNYVQLGTPHRALADGVGPESAVHVWNLVSCYLKYTSGQEFNIAWRMHFLWYLESLSGQDQRLETVTEAMRQAQTPVLKIDDRPAVDFSQEHVTCSNVLRERLGRMEQTLFGQCRPEVTTYLRTFEQFLSQFGDTRSLG